LAVIVLITPLLVPVYRFSDTADHDLARRFVGSVR
jgi:hypothetical protein